MKALLISGSNQYGVVSDMLSGMSRDLERLGVRVSQYSTDDEPSTQSQLDFNNYDFIVSFNGVGCDMILRDKPNSRVKVFVFLVDHPLHLLNRIVGLDFVLLCVCRSHVTFAELCGFKAVFFPHAVSSDEILGFTDSQNKSREFLLPISHFNEGAWKTKLGKHWNNISALVEASSNVNDFAFFIGVLPEGNRPAKTELSQGILELLKIVDFYKRGASRRELLQTIDKWEVPVHLVGRGTDKYSADFTNLVDLGEKKFIDLKSQIESTKYVIHPVPGFSNALHDRVVYAAAKNTLIISDKPDSLLLVEPKLRVLGTNTKPNLTDAQYERLVEQNRNLITENHTWKCRFENLLSQNDIA